MASRSLGTLTIDLIAQIGGFVAGMDKAARASEQAAARIEKTIKHAGEAVEATFAVLGAERLVHAVLEATIENENALKQLEARLASTGATAGRSSQQIQEFAKQLQRSTTFSHDAVIGAETLLLTFQNIKGDTLDKATVAALNLATALKTDLPTAARTIGLALNDPTRGVQRLQRAGVALTADQAKLIKELAQTGNVARAQTLILDALSRAYGGAAVAAADTLGGSLEQLKNAFHDLLEVSDTKDAQQGVQDLVKVLEDPQTVAAAKNLTDGIIFAFTEVVKAIRWTVSTAHWFGEQVAKLKFGDADDPMKALAAEISDIEKELTALTQNGFFKGSKTPEYVENLRKTLQQLKEAQLLQTLKPEYQSPPRANAPEAENVGLLGGKAKPGGQTFSKEELDDVDASIKAQKELVAHQKHVEELYEQQRLTLLQHSELIGKTTELEKTRFEITDGALKDILPAEKEQLLILASEATANDKAAEAAKKHAEALQHGKEVTKELGTPYEAYIERVTELEDLLSQQAITLETYRHGVERAARQMKDASEKTDAWSVFMEQAHRNLQDILANTLTGAFEGQKTNLLKSFTDMLKKMAAQAAAAKILDALFGAANNNSGPWLDFIKNVFGGFFGGNKAAANQGRAAGGPVSAGQLYRVGEQGPEWMVAPADGYVLPAGAQPASGGGLMVNIVNPPSQPTISESRGANGERQLQIMFDKMFQSSLSDGRFDGSMRGRYGIRPAVGGGR
jgi:hypothetical protein